MYKRPNVSVKLLLAPTIYCSQKVTCGKILFWPFVKSRHTSLFMRFFTSATGVGIKVGQNCNENDQLVKTSHQDFLWCHLESGPSAHAVIESTNPDPDTVHDALQLVKYFSKGKGIQSNMIMAKVRDVKPVKNKPGLVTLTRNVKKRPIRTDISTLRRLGIESA